jgi:hypothetical protein
MFKDANFTFMLRHSSATNIEPIECSEDNATQRLLSLFLCQLRLLLFLLSVIDE